MWRYEFGFLEDQQTKDPHEKGVFDCSADDDVAAINFYRGLSQRMGSPNKSNRKK